MMQIFLRNFFCIIDFALFLVSAKNFINEKLPLHGFPFQKHKSMKGAFLLFRTCIKTCNKTSTDCNFIYILRRHKAEHCPVRHIKSDNIPNPDIYTLCYIYKQVVAADSKDFHRFVYWC